MREDQYLLEAKPAGPIYEHLQPITLFLTLHITVKWRAEGVSHRAREHLLL